SGSTTIVAVMRGCSEQNLREGEGEGVVGVECPRLKPLGHRGHRVRNVVLVAPSHRRARLHGEAGGREGKNVELCSCVFRPPPAGIKGQPHHPTRQSPPT